MARFIAVIGQEMLTVAVGWELYERTHSAMALGLVGLTQMLPILLLILPAGHVAHLFGPVFSVVSGGVGTILVVIAIALIWPEIREYGSLDGRT